MVHSLGLLIFEFRMACMCGSSVFNLLDESISPIKALMLRTEVLVLCRVTFSSFLYTKVFCKPSAGFVACLSRSSSFIGSSRGFLVYNLQHHGWKVWPFTDPLEILGFDVLTCRLCWIVPRVWTVAWCICVDIEVKPPYSLASSHLKLVPAPHLSASQTSQTQHTSHTHTISFTHTIFFWGRSVLSMCEHSQKPNCSRRGTCWRVQCNLDEHDMWDSGRYIAFGNIQSLW